ncbi:MAG: ribose 5-phosphate isomerase [Chloroflexota bacterium]|jgi:ribose 5-phosphate isomerase A|nr:ribose 5-phosphate isomerase [Chloroflexota bacterium]
MEPRQAAAERALEEVRDGMLLGLGTGSTAYHFINGVGRLVAAGMRLTAVATSQASADQAAALGVSLTTSIDRPIDLTVDGADEIDPHLSLVKGLGGALLREKVVAAASTRMVVIATVEKLVPHLGTRSPLPVEVLPLLWERTAATLMGFGLRPALRAAGTAAETAPFISDNGNYILDCAFTPPVDIAALAMSLDAVPGVLGHGLFIGLASLAVVAEPDGTLREVLPA